MNAPQAPGRFPVGMVMGVVVGEVPSLRNSMRVALFISK
jgi:TctA family transporter